MKLNFHAWKGTHYVSLAELLGEIGHRYGDAEWYVRAVEVTARSGSEEMENIDPRQPLQLEELMRLVAPDLQIIWGEIHAIDREGRCMSICAIDSTSWDVETEDAEVLSIIRRVYPDAHEI